jgi:hypothetical protein
LLKVWPNARQLKMKKVMIAFLIRRMKREQPVWKPKHKLKADVDVADVVDKVVVTAAAVVPVADVDLVRVEAQLVVVNVVVHHKVVVLVADAVRVEAVKNMDEENHPELLNGRSFIIMIDRTIQN